MPRITSTSCMTGTGFMKCMPMNASGRRVAAARRVIEIEDVFDARIAAGLADRVELPKSSFLTASFSTIASTTASAPARSSSRVVVAMRPSAAALSSAVRLPLATSRSRFFSIAAAGLVEEALLDVDERDGAGRRPPRRARSRCPSARRRRRRASGSPWSGLYRERRERDARATRSGSADSAPRRLVERRSDDHAIARRPESRHQRDADGDDRGDAPDEGADEGHERHAAEHDESGGERGRPPRGRDALRRASVRAAGRARPCRRSSRRRRPPRRRARSGFATAEGSSDSAAPAARKSVSTPSAPASSEPDQSSSADIAARESGDAKKYSSASATASQTESAIRWSPPRTEGPAPAPSHGARRISER